MTADPNGWPDPSRPGVPLHPEREGHHWCYVYPSLPFPIVWRHDGIGWCWANGYSHQVAATRWTYLGPCLTPADVAAAEQAGAVKMREDIAAWWGHASETDAAWWSRDVSHIRAIPLPTSALDAMLAAAREEGRIAGLREAVAYLQKQTTALRLRDAEDRGIPNHMGHSFEADTGDAWAAAILARAEGKP